MMRPPMNRLLPAIGLLLLLTAPARADDAPPAACNMITSLLVSQDQGTVSIACTGATEALGNQLADVLSRIMQDRIDPDTVLAKLDELERVPAEGVARKLDDLQRQAVIQALVGKPADQISISAHLGEPDSGDYAKDLAQPLIMAGWQIDGHQVRRIAPKNLEGVHGVALVVHDRDTVPAKALLLRSALSAAHIMAPLVVDPTLPPGATMLWIGRHPVFLGADAKP
jgi:hypothetical protein